MPYAIAILKGNYLAPNLIGTVKLYPWNNGTIVSVEVINLPKTKHPANNRPPTGPFAFHIHEDSACIFDEKSAFQKTKGHFNPTNEPHPFHAGDLPSLLSNNGYSYMVVYTNRFKPEDVLQRTVVIHLNPDDYRSQPSGDSGKKIACGVIKKYK